MGASGTPPASRNTGGTDALVTGSLYPTRLAAIHPLDLVAALINLGSPDDRTRFGAPGWFEVADSWLRNAAQEEAQQLFVRHWLGLEATAARLLSGTTAQVSYLIWIPEMALAMINLWISLVPSKMVRV